MSTTESEVRALVEDWSASVGRRDIERTVSLFSPDNIFYDIVPPLQTRGCEAVREDNEHWFAIWQSDFETEIRDLRILADGDLAIAHFLHRASGPLKAGGEWSYWVRITFGCKRSGGRWRIVHDHVSVPINPKTRAGMMDLVPEETEAAVEPV
jgi:uncharacterized protein (TIGR02246 family)